MQIMLKVNLLKLLNLCINGAMVVLDINIVEGTVVIVENMVAINPYDVCCPTHDRYWSSYGTNDCQCNCNFIACAKKNWFYAPTVLHLVLLAWFPRKKLQMFIKKTPPLIYRRGCLRVFCFFSYIKSQDGKNNNEVLCNVRHLRGKLKR
ncbi:hypothetical protein JOC94_001983 [Bacillus thermophilus]|uniref:Uncharacterized protein n=1 Tax=Siminovitchia thermophila TaxID=1245522 RepID=A0ABS2R5U4_9BACI|nr:hypothetical protein [Siminovitchia thermophila]ONK22376.1 hypothetical protein BLX87_16485 [Bacillus sp. VT-16-64]